MNDAVSHLRQHVARIATMLFNDMATTGGFVERLVEGNICSTEATNADIYAKITGSKFGGQEIMKIAESMMQESRSILDAFMAPENFRIYVEKLEQNSNKYSYYMVADHGMAERGSPLVDRKSVV